MSTFKFIGIKDKKNNQIDLVVPLEDYESIKDTECQLPDLLCLKKQKSLLQIPINRSEISEVDKILFDSLQQDEVIIFDAFILTKDFVIGRHIGPKDFKFIKIYNIQKFNEPKALENLTKVTQYLLFNCHYVLHPQSKMKHFDFTTFLKAEDAEKVLES